MQPGSDLPKINPQTGKPFPVQLDDEELKSELDPLSFDVLRKATCIVTGKHLSVIKLKSSSFTSAGAYPSKSPVLLWNSIGLESSLFSGSGMTQIKSPT